MTLVPRGAPWHMTWHSKAPSIITKNLGAFRTASAPVWARTMALSTFFLKNSSRPKVLMQPLRASTHNTADRKASGNDGGHPSAICAKR